MKDTHGAYTEYWDATAPYFSSAISVASLSSKMAWNAAIDAAMQMSINCGEKQVAHELKDLKV